MVASLRHYWSVAACWARLAVQRQLEYPLFLVSWLLMIPIQYFSGIWILKLLVDRFHPLNGWGFPELAFLYGLSLLSHGLSVIFFIRTWGIDGMVIQGEFDRLLLRPMNVFFQLITSYVNFIGLVDLIPAVTVFVYGCHLVGFEWSAANIGKLVFTVLGGVLIRAALYIMLGSIAFWTKRSGSMVSFALTMMERATLYPLNIYPHIIQVVLTFLIPIGFISFYPAVDFLNKSSGFQIPLGMALWTPLIGIVFFGIAQWIFTSGLKNYESSGS